MQWLKSPNPKLLRAVASIVLAAVVIGMGLGVSEMRNLNTHYSMSQFMPKDHPLYASDRLVKKTFHINDREPVIVNLLLHDSAKGTWLQKDRVNVIDQATKELTGVEHIEKVLSIANVEVANNSATGIQVDRLLGMVPEKEWKSRVLNDSLLTPGLVSKDGRKVTLIADIPLLSEAEMNEMMTQVRARVGKIAEAGNAQLMVSGVLPLQTEMTTLLSKELVNFFGLAFLVCLITLLAYFRSLSTVFVCLVLVIIANIATFTSLAVLGIPFSVLSSALPIMCSIEALAIGSHTLLIFGDNYRQAMMQPNPPSKAWVAYTTYKSLLFPNFLMSTTTIIGFATLISSQVPLIRQFSQSVSCGILMSCICMQIALPSLMYLFPIPVARSWTGAKARWALWVIHHRRLVVFGILGIVTVFVLNGMRLNWSVQLYDDLPKVGDIKTSADLIDKELGGMIPLEVMISKTGEENPWYEPARLKALRKVLNDWRRNPAIGSAIGLTDLLNTGIQKLDSRKAVAETLFLYGFSGADNPTVHFLSTDGSATRLSFRMKDVKADEMGGVVTKIQSDIMKAFPGFDVKVGGMAAMVHPLNAELSADLIYGLWQSLLLISILLVVVFRSFRLAFIAAVPNLMAPLALLATMAYLKTPIKPVVAIIFSIALGLAYNNTVFLLTRLKKIQSSFKGATDIITRTWYQEGNPCLFSSLAVIGGFAVFLASYFSPNRTFGAYMLWSIGVGLVGDLLLLPALLRMFPWFIFPGDGEVTVPVPAVAPRSWARNGLVLFALITGMSGPSAAAAADAPPANVVHTPFILTMKKDAFAQLVFDGIVAKSTTGSGSSPIADITVTDPMSVKVTGITLNLKYDFNAPESAQSPSQWLLNSKSIVAELNVGSVVAHLDKTVQRGEDTVVVHLDGTCSNVKLALPEGSATATGKLVLGQLNGAPRMLLQNFQAQWTPGSWQVVSMNCSGPQGFDTAVANAARTQLTKIDPYFNQIRDAIQAQLDNSMTNVSQQQITAGTPFQTGQTMLLKNFSTKLNAAGDTVAKGDAYFYFTAAKGGCGADVKAFSAQPTLNSGDTALFVPFIAIKSLFACAHSDGSLAFDTDSTKFTAFQGLMHSTLEKNAVWPDLNNFDENTLMKFHGESAAPPVLSGEKALGGHVFTAQLQQKMSMLMQAPQNRKYVPYVNVQGFFSGPVRVTVAGGKVSMKPDSTGQLALSGAFVPSYVSNFHPSGDIDWTRITPEAQKALLEQGWTFTMPTWGVNPKVLLKTTDGDLQGTNFRLGFQVIRK
ncbi:MAG: efflux RND transporter permease subunit [Bdellovibrionota bacterium]